MRRPRSGIGAELAPLVLILACLAGSLALIASAHRRATARKPPPRPAVAVALPPSPTAPKAAPVAEPPPDEPEPPTPPTPEDPTPRVLAKLTSAEAEQWLEASRADRKAAALVEARKAALAQSEKWRRRESLVRLQLDSLDAKARKLEAQVDDLALERDALEKERDVRKALASENRSRPGQAILPHRGQNGTWRRPIVVECVNGMAILRPQGVGFGLLELASGFGPTSNPFVATVAREAIRIQGNRSPDGQSVVPYIFFLVRPDGIRSYYEARGRLEPLGITFGYELADQEWEVDFPDLDDVKTWDGSPPGRPDGPGTLARDLERAPGASPAEDDDFPNLGPAVERRRGATSPRDEASGGEFTWPPRARDSQGGGGRAGLEPPTRPPGGGPGLRFSSSSSNRGAATADSPGGPGPQGGPPAPAREGTAAGPARRPGIRPGVDPEFGPGDPASSGAPRELSLGGGPIRPLDPARPDPTGPPEGHRAGPGPKPAPPPTGGVEGPPAPKPPGPDDPANTRAWPPRAGAEKPADRPGQAPGDSADSVDRTPPVRHVGPFSKPLAMGLDSLEAPDSPASQPGGDPTQPDGTPGPPAAPGPGARARASTPKGSAGSPSNARGIGQGGPPGTTPPPGSIGVGMAGPPPGPTPPAGRPDPSSTPTPGLPSAAAIDRRFEVVLVCGPKGVIVQPGAYRVTADALKDRDGLLKKQIVALVKAKRTADPRTTLEPRVRFLVQPGGDKTYWTARSQFLLSGLDWPITTQVADADHWALLPSESW